MVKSRDQCLKRMTEKRWNVLDAIDIRSRISFKSTRNLKTAGKYIAKLQLTETSKNPSFIVCPNMNTTIVKLYTMEAGSFKLTYLNTIYPSVRSHDKYMHMISSYNGLVCCVNICDEDVESKLHDLQIWICNPSTRETLLLPQGRPSFNCEPSVGVAYGSDIGEYRVFRIFCTGEKVPKERWSYGSALAYECEMYSSSIGSWQNIGPVPCVPMRSTCRHRSSHVCVRGKVYWLVSLYEPDEILSIDMEGRFEVIKLPPYEETLHSDDKITDGTYLFMLQGSLALLVLHPGDIDIWIWKQVDDKYTWERDYCVPNSRFEMDDIVLHITSSKNKIIFVTETHWFSYDVVTKEWENIKRGYRNGFVNPALFPFTQSVLPCNGGVRL